MEMEREKYESPEFQFKEMKLLEKVAERCWGYGHAFVDHDADKSTPPKDYWFSPNGCDGAKDAERLANLIREFPDLEGLVTEKDVKVNTKDSEFIDYPGKS